MRRAVWPPEAEATCLQQHRGVDSLGGESHGHSPWCHLWALWGGMCRPGGHMCGSGC